MHRAVATLLLQTPTPTPGSPTPGVGPDELVDYWPLVTRAVWFVVGFLIVVLVGWFLLAPAIERAVRRRNRNNPTLQDAVPRYVRLAVLLVAFYVGAGTAGYGRFVSDSALIVAAGTLAVGVAAQTVLGSLVSGLVLVSDPEFNVGDYIEWDDGTGTIQSITLRVTRVVTPDGELVTVPNTTLTSQAITRPYGRTRYRIETRIGVDYEADLDDSVALAEATAREVAEIAEQPSPRAFVTELGGDEIELRVFYWIADPELGDDVGAESAFVRALTDRFDAAGIEISPPSAHDLQGRIGVDDRNSGARSAE